MYKITASIVLFVTMAFAFSTASANSSYLSTGKDSITISTSEETSSPLQIESGVRQDGQRRCFVGDTILYSALTDTSSLQLNQEEIPLSTTLPLTENQKKKKRVSAFFAFPFPFGFVAAHRVMLGTKPWIPIVYVATFGGCFGLLPLIDFCVILCSKDIEQYENNPNLFMWIK